MPGDHFRPTSLLALVVLNGCEPRPVVHSHLSDCRLVLEVACQVEGQHIEAFGVSKRCGASKTTFVRHRSQLPEGDKVTIQYGETGVIEIPVQFPEAVPDVAHCTAMVDGGAPPKSDHGVFKTFDKNQLLVEHPWGQLAGVKQHILRLETHPDAQVVVDGVNVETDNGVFAIEPDFGHWMLGAPLEPVYQQPPDDGLEPHELSRLSRAEQKDRSDRRDAIRFREIRVDLRPIAVSFPDETVYVPEITLTVDAQTAKRLIERRLKQISEGKGIGGRETPAHPVLVLVGRDKPKVPGFVRYAEDQSTADQVTHLGVLQSGADTGRKITCSYQQFRSATLKLFETDVVVYDARTGERLGEMTVPFNDKPKCPETMLFQQYDWSTKSSLHNSLEVVRTEIASFIRSIGESALIEPGSEQSPD